MRGLITFVKVLKFRCPKMSFYNDITSQDSDSAQADDNILCDSKITCAPSEDSDQPGHSPGLCMKVLIGLSRCLG